MDTGVQAAVMKVFDGDTFVDEGDEGFGEFGILSLSLITESIDPESTFWMFCLSVSILADLMIANLFVLKST